ncbi:MAG: sigma-70 family RNA polymerase sigma factor [Planctomycetota bacterium]|jgi:RNA polymerase sigma factor (sigma-70 family)
MSDVHDLGPLLAEAGWIRALARSLVDDPQSAEDLAQETMLSAMAAKPRSDRPLRGWLATVLRNHRQQDLRSAGRVDQRERRVAKAEAQPSTLEVVERLTIQRDLAEAVLSLDEPYRSAITLRFFEGKNQREIASITGCKATTVNSRIQRGLQKLRVLLDKKYGGDRRAWLAVLQPLAGMKSLSWGLVFQAILMNSPSKIAISLVVILTGAILWIGSSTEPNEATAVTADSDEFGSAPATDLSDRIALDEPGERVRVTESGAAAAPPIEEPMTRVSGKVMDQTGLSLAGVNLVSRGLSGGEGWKSTSDAAGRFSIPVDASSKRIVADDERYATVLAGYAEMTTDAEAVVVVAARGQVTGRVVDSGGLPLPEVALSISLPANLGASLGTVLDYSLPERWSTSSDADGRFNFESAPLIPRATLSAKLDGYSPELLPLQQVNFVKLEITMQRPSPSSQGIAGTVIDPSGAIVPGAKVALGLQGTVADEFGRFAFTIEEAPEPARLLAISPGFMPTRESLLDHRDDAGGFSQDIVMRLGAGSLAITGRVVDQRGDPVSGARVWLDDPTRFGFSGGSFLQVETILSGAEPEVWSTVSTDANGRFTLSGLLDREYRIQAMQPETLVAVRSDRLAAGTIAPDLVLPTDEVHAEISGQALDSRGEPVAGVRLYLGRLTFETAVPGGTYDRVAPGASTVTQADGKFRFQGVPRQGVSLSYTGDEIMLGSISLGAEDDLQNIRLVLQRRINLQISIGGDEEIADRVKVLDLDGRSLLLRIMRGANSHTGRSVEISEGLSQVFSVSDQARTVVLYQDGEEIGRRDIQPEPGALNRIEF